MFLITTIIQIYHQLLQKYSHYLILIFILVYIIVSKKKFNKNISINVSLSVINIYLIYMNYIDIINGLLVLITLYIILSTSKYHILSIIFD